MTERSGIDLYLSGDTTLALDDDEPEEDPVNARWRAAQPARAEAARAEILANRPKWDAYIAGVNGTYPEATSDEVLPPEASPQG